MNTEDRLKNPLTGIRPVKEGDVKPTIVLTERDLNKIWLKQEIAKAYMNLGKSLPKELRED